MLRNVYCGVVELDLERFIESCREAIVGADATSAVREIVAKAARDVAVLGPDIIHSVVNPIGQRTALR